MGRWAPDARGRLQRAAMELYTERGFEQTTVAEIAERAGLTKRTFFRHFADKRDVLFANAHALQDLVVRAVAGAPASAGPLAAVTAGLEAAARAIGEFPEGARMRQVVINARPELRERELIKLATLAAAVADTLRERGVKDRAASLSAEAGVAAFRVAFTTWTDEPAPQDLVQLVRGALDELGSLTGA